MRLPYIFLAIVFALACGKARRAPRNIIERENALDGDPDWSSGRDVTNKGELYAYADMASARAGDTVHVMVSSNEQRPASWALYRLGWYSGAQARRVVSGSRLSVGPQQACPMDPDTGMVRCSWTPSFSVPITADFVSGLFVVKITRDDGFVRFVPLVVIDDRTPPLLVQAGLNTYQAYNLWGGASLYRDTTGTLPRGRAVKVSFDRPFDGDRGLGLMLHWDAPFAAFLERFGYDASYTTNADISLRGAAHLTRATAFVSAGHDEYWSSNERDVVTAALASHVSLLFLGGNIAYWKVRYEDVAAGTNPRVMVCYRDPKIDPDQADVTTRFRDPGVDRPENLLLGIMYESIVTAAFPWVVKDASSWLYSGTGLSDRDAVPLLVGFEYDRVFENGATPEGVVVLSRSPLVTTYGSPSWSESVTYRAGSGALVFSAGTLLWNHALDATSSSYDPRVVRMTANAIREAAGVPIPPELENVAAPSAAPIGPFAQSVATVVSGLGSPTGITEAPDGSLIVADPERHQVLRIAPDSSHAVSVLAGDGTAGSADGVPGQRAEFRSPVSVASDPAGNIYVADAGNHSIRKIANDPVQTVTTVAGGLGVSGLADGAGASARFSYPVSVTIAPSGAVIVADKLNHRIRAIDPATQSVTTVAGTTQGNEDGPGAIARLSYPTALAVAGSGTIYVVGTYFTGMNEMGYTIKTIAPDATHSVTTIAKGPAGFQDGVVPGARFTPLGGMALDNGSLIVADGGNIRIREFWPHGPIRFVHTLAGSGRFGNEDGLGEVASFGMPMGVVLSRTGVLYVADSANGTIRAVKR